jgi:8-amino-7-oxononanoate synthase|uniref:8-amino-7-oxononanoate synthase n=1 Tax=Leptospirillum ferriphilum TaxID=178606 RepID=A0A7C3QSI0_9BACT
MENQGYLEANDRLLQELDRSGQRKQLPTRGEISLSSNDYLNLSRHPQLIEKGIDELRRSGTGATGSRLLSGNHPLNRDLEVAIASFKNGPSALVFSTGYQANLSTIGALAELVDIFYSDALNHASLIDGLRLARKETIVFPHNDVQWIERDLEVRTRSTGTSPRFMVVTESLFSMEGDMAPLRKLSDLIDARDGLLLVDEAHATGTLGKEGRGGFEQEGLLWDPDRILVTGTFSKAMGGLGGFTVCHPDYRELLISRGRGFAYSTALPPAVLASNLEALRILGAGNDLVKALSQRVSELREALGAPPGQSPIIPVRGEKKALASFQEYLLESALWAPLIYPPTVPEGSEQIRLSVTLGWEKDWIRRIREAFHRETGLQAG